MTTAGKEKGKAESGALLAAENAERMVTGRLGAASTEKEGAKVERDVHLAENAEGLVIGLLAGGTVERAALEKVERDVHLAENAEGLVIGLQAAASMEREGAKVEEAVPLVEGNAEIMVTDPGLRAVDTVKADAPGKAESAEGLVIGLQAAASMEREGAKVEKGAPLAEKEEGKVGAHQVEESAESLATGRGLQAVDTAETGAAGAHLAEGNALHLQEGNAAEAASASGTRREGKSEASAKEALPKGKEAREGSTAQNS